FDFTPVGAGIALAGLIFLAVGWRLIPRGRKGAIPIDAAFNIEGYTTEVTIPQDSPIVGKTVRELEQAGEDEVELIALMRGSQHRIQPAAALALKADDIIILQGEPAALERVVALEKLKLTRDKTREPDTPADEIGAMEAVVTAGSELV